MRNENEAFAWSCCFAILNQEQEGIHEARLLKKLAISNFNMVKLFWTIQLEVVHEMGPSLTKNGIW